MPAKASAIRAWARAAVQAALIVSFWTPNSSTFPERYAPGQRLPCEARLAGCHRLFRLLAEPVRGAPQLTDPPLGMLAAGRDLYRVALHLG